MSFLRSDNPSSSSKVLFIISFFAFVLVGEQSFSTSGPSALAGFFYFSVYYYIHACLTPTTNLCPLALCCWLEPSVLLCWSMLSSKRLVNFGFRSCQPPLSTLRALSLAIHPALLFIAAIGELGTANFGGAELDVS